MMTYRNLSGLTGQPAGPAPGFTRPRPTMPRSDPGFGLARSGPTGPRPTPPGPAPAVPAWPGTASAGPSDALWRRPRNLQKRSGNLRLVFYSGQALA
jgi:hypothetical protein